MNNKANKRWTKLGQGTSVDISGVYNEAFEYLVLFRDSNNIYTQFLIPYQLLGEIINHGYYYDSKYYASKSLNTSSSNISINTNWTKISNNGITSNTGTIYVYYR